MVKQENYLILLKTDNCLIERYFTCFPLSVRENVQFIVIYMYTPYVSLVKKCFPNPKIIIDRFHIVQHIGRTFRNHRITWTNRLLKSSSLAEKRQGKQHKKYWKLLQKNQEELDSLNRRWRPSFKTYLTETELVDRLLSYSVELTQGYTLYQDFLYAVHKRDQTYFDVLLTQNILFLTCQLLIKPLYEPLKSTKNKFIMP